MVGVAAAFASITFLGRVTGLNGLVPLVGVMAADSALNLPDFRAAERTFQLLSQVAGRAGRHELPGEVVIQTYSPTHPAVVAAAAHDYHAFYDAELPDREELGWPPYRALANAVVAGPDARLAREAAARFAEAMEGRPDIEVFGPHDAPLSQVRGLRRYQVLLKLGDPADARRALRRAIAVAQEPGVRVTLDVDPYNLM